MKFSEKILKFIKEITENISSNVSSIRSKTDKLTFDTNNRIAIQNPPNLDVLLSSRASESTLSGIKTQTDKLTFDSNNRLAIQNPPNLDVLLSSRASETTLSSIKAQTDKLTFDSENRLAIQNPPNLDVLLSTRASEETLLLISDILASIEEYTTRIDELLYLLTFIFHKGNLLTSVFNEPITANTDIFTTPLYTDQTLSLFRIFVCFDTTGTLSVVKKSDTTEITMLLNSGSPLNAGCLYAFDIIVTYGEEVNLRFSTDAVALDVKVFEYVIDPNLT